MNDRNENDVIDSGYYTEDEPNIRVEIRGKEIISLSVPERAINIMWGVAILLPIGACVIMHFLIRR